MINSATINSATINASGSSITYLRTEFSNSYIHTDTTKKEFSTFYSLTGAIPENATYSINYTNSLLQEFNSLYLHTTVLDYSFSTSYGVATVSNLLEFSEKYTDGITIDFSTNYVMTQILSPVELVEVLRWSEAVELSQVYSISPITVVEHAYTYDIKDVTPITTDLSAKYSYIIQSDLSITYSDADKTVTENVISYTNYSTTRIRLSETYTDAARTLSETYINYTDQQKTISDLSINYTDNQTIKSNLLINYTDYQQTNNSLLVSYTDNPIITYFCCYFSVVSIIIFQL